MTDFDLEPGRYFDGTYEWVYEGDDEWTPLMAPTGMPSAPPLEGLERVLTRRVPVEESGLDLDPMAWVERDGQGRHAHLAGVDPDGSCRFDPRPGFSKDRERYIWEPQIELAKVRITSAEKALQEATKRLLSGFADLQRIYYNREIKRNHS